MESKNGGSLSGNVGADSQAIDISLVDIRNPENVVLVLDYMLQQEADVMSDVIAWLDAYNDTQVYLQGSFIKAVRDATSLQLRRINRLAGRILPDIDAAIGNSAVITANDALAIQQSEPVSNDLAPFSGMGEPSEDPPLTIPPGEDPPPWPVPPPDEPPTVPPIPPGPLPPPEQPPPPLPPAQPPIEPLPGEFCFAPPWSQMAQDRRVKFCNKLYASVEGLIGIMPTNSDGQTYDWWNLAVRIGGDEYTQMHYRSDSTGNLSFHPQWIDGKVRFKPVMTLEVPRYDMSNLLPYGEEAELVWSNYGIAKTNLTEQLSDAGNWNYLCDKLGVDNDGETGIPVVDAMIPPPERA